MNILLRIPTQTNHALAARINGWLYIEQCLTAPLRDTGRGGTGHKRTLTDPHRYTAHRAIGSLISNMR